MVVNDRFAWLVNDRLARLVNDNLGYRWWRHRQQRTAQKKG
jgi:hypothetical protein